MPIFWLNQGMKKLFPPIVTLAAVQQGNQGTFGDFLGLEFMEVGTDFLKGKMAVDKRHLRPGGIMNGGVTLALVETVGSVAARCVIWGQDKNTLGIQVNASHLRIAKSGDVLWITARPTHIGRSTHLWDVAIENQDGKLVCTGRITLLVVEGTLING